MPTRIFGPDPLRLEGPATNRPASYTLLQLFLGKPEKGNEPTTKNAQQNPELAKAPVIITTTLNVYPQEQEQPIQQKQTQLPGSSAQVSLNLAQPLDYLGLTKALKHGVIVDLDVSIAPGQDSQALHQASDMTKPIKTRIAVDLIAIKIEPWQLVPQDAENLARITIRIKLKDLNITNFDLHIPCQSLKHRPNINIIIVVENTFIKNARLPIKQTGAIDLNNSGFINPCSQQD